jgi:hypothetical protein
MLKAAFYKTLSRKHHSMCFGDGPSNKVSLYREFKKSLKLSLLRNPNLIVMPVSSDIVAKKIRRRDF